MALTPGTRLGVYDITAPIGVGGMGEVYQATDTNLKRQVAIKVLPASVAGDTDRLARFQREAEVLAALNHPNIAAIYGLERSSDMTALVMELVEGEDLSQRIGRGAIPLDEALLIAKQIADALEAAHEQGIIHRDLKPANIKVRSDSTVKVLDFGLAKAMEPAAGSSPSMSMSPTLTTPAMTQAGMILGTAAYMAPEQARGKVVDKRADIWAFGVVLYEMLTGRRAFEDEDVSLTLSKVLQREPDFDALPPAVPARMSQVLRVCLRKDPKQRIGDIRDVRLALEGAFETATPTATSATTVAGPASGGRLAWALAGILLVAAVGLSVPATLYFRRAVPDAAAVRFEVSPPAGLVFAAGGSTVELSPDGRRLAFMARSSEASGGVGIFVRSLDELTARRLTEAEAFSSFFWSADSQSIAYFGDGKLKRVSASGGPSQVIGNLPVGRERGRVFGSWGSEGVILFSADNRTSSAIFRVPASGGQPVALTPSGPGTAEGALAPVFLPDGRHYVAVAREGAVFSAFVGGLDSTERQPLPGVTGPVRYSSAGYLVFVRDGSLMAQRFDADHRQPSGDVFPIADQVADAMFSVSLTGALAYRTGGVAASSQLVWFDRAGKRLRVEPMTGSLQAPSLTRDGKRVAIERTDASGTHVWVIDLVRGTSTLLSDDPSIARRPVFSADGAQVAFSRDRVNGQGGTIYRKSSSGTGAEERVGEGELTDWSPDGRFLSFINNGDLWAQPLTGDPKPTRIVSTKGNDRRGRFSPDGRWIAYESDFSGRFEIYVQRFPPTDERIQVSANGGNSAYWRSDGEELFFNAPDRKIMAVEVTPGSMFRASPPRTVFDVPGVINNGRFAVTPDGQQFLIPLQTENKTSEPITVVLNWASGLKK